MVSDVRLPGRDGLALFDEIRARHPSLPVILLTAHGTIPDAVEATARGVFSYLTKPFDGKELLDKIAQALALSAPAQPARPAATKPGARASSAAPTAWPSCWPRPSMVARSRRQRADRAAKAAPARNCWPRPSTTPARARAKPFVAVNCGAIPEALLESELFGHVKGAFTGAVANHTGLFQAADGGTLFLDEIGDMPPALQVKLLRVLQERAVRPVGASQSMPVDVRILSATHRDLDAAMAAGPVPRRPVLPAQRGHADACRTLAERREDIPLLANHFLATAGGASTASALSGFAPEALKALTTAAWPGNVRQLYNVVEQVCALATTPLIPLALVQRALRVPSVRGAELRRGARSASSATTWSACSS